MNKVRNYINQFHPIVWVLLAGTVIARGSSFMTLPFLAIYLSKTIDLSPIWIGITIGISPLTATVGGFLGGHLSDRFGRKPVMLASLFAWAGVFYGFSLVESPVWFIVLNAFNGLCSSFFEPTSQALIADITEKKRRMRAFSLRYTAINIGASVGPLLGAYLALSSAGSAFVITGTVYLIYGVALFLLLKKLPLPTSQKIQAEKVSMLGAFKILTKDKAFGFLILGTILVNIGYSQVESNLPQHLDSTLENGVVIYSVLLSLNAVMVVLLQMPISHYVERFRTMQVMVAGSVLMAAGLFGFSLVEGWATAIIAMAVLTIGEILIFPSSSYMVDQLAVEHLRGTYFGASQFRKLGHFAGPIMGGYFLTEINGSFLFIVISAMVLSSILFFLKGNQVQLKIAVATKQQT